MPRKTRRAARGKSVHNQAMTALTANSILEKAIATGTAPSAPPALQVVNLRKRYGAVTALDDVSFTVNRGEIVGLLGPNGAGKTTTINMILGVLEPTSGRVSIDEIDIAKDRARALSRTNFAAVYAALPGNLTVSENLRFFGLLYAIDALGSRVDALLKEFDLKHLRNTKCGLLSSGEQTRAALAKALLNKPQLLLLDEPTASLDPSAAQIIREKIRGLASNEGCGILWTSHNMLEVEAVCDRVLLLSHGKVLLEGNPRTLAHDHGASSLEELFIRVAREPLIDPRGTAT
jgi:ABC-2 type transport system ATP-binding protein